MDITGNKHETDCVEQALTLLEGALPPTRVKDGVCLSEEAGREQKLLELLSRLLEDYRDKNHSLERCQKELAVFRDVNAETNLLLEKKIEEISLLRLITDTTSRAILSQDPFTPILEEVTAIVGGDHGSLFLRNPDTGDFEVRATSGEKSDEIREALLRMARQIVDRVMSSGEPVSIENTRRASLFSLDGCDSEIASLLSFPLVVEEETIGVLNVSSRQTGSFSPETERILHIIAGQIAIAVKNAHLYGEIRKTKEYLENLVERAGDAIFTLDRSHAIVSWNRGAERIFHRSKAEVVGSTFYEFVQEESVSSLRNHIESVLNSETIVTIETEAVAKAGSWIQIALTLSPIRGAKGQVIGVSGIAKDITERKEVEEELRRLNEAKTNFVSTVSHELRTPLTSIKSFTEILLHDMTSLSEDTVKRYLNLINEECDRLSALITSLLDLQKLNAGRLEVNLEPLVLAALVRQAADLFESVALRNRIELIREFLVPDEMTEVLGDRGRLMQILSNLLSNALKYSNSGGHVKITLLSNNGELKLTVADDGMGIPVDQLDKVFEKFHQVDNSVTRAKGGTGLGLAITKELVHLHGGKIWVESREGCGCKFNVLLPLAT